MVYYIYSCILIIVHAFTHSRYDMWLLLASHRLSLYVYKKWKTGFENVNFRIIKSTEQDNMVSVILSTAVEIQVHKKVNL